MTTPTPPINKEFPAPRGELDRPIAASEIPKALVEESAIMTEARAAEMEAAGEATAGVPAEAPRAEGIERLRARLRRPKKPAPVIPQVRDATTRQVEKIMEAGLKDAFQALTPMQKQEFKIKGEATARNIRDLLRGAHVKVKKIFRLLLQWLKFLPGVNRFFLEQEAKIKADKIIALKHYSDNKN